MSDFKFLGQFLGRGSNFSKDGHDVSSQEALSMPFGVTLPLASRFTVPDEHYKCRFGMYTQTAPMREDNFQELFTNLSAVYVPITHVWRDYLSMTSSARSTRKDPVYNFNNYYPTFDLNLLLRRWIAPMYITQQLFQYIWSTYTDFLDSAYWSSSDDAFVTLNNGTLEPIFKNQDSAPEMLLEQCMRNLGSVIPVNVEYLTLRWVLDTISDFKTDSGCLFCFDALRLLDNLGYGNFVPYCEVALKNFYEYASNQGFSTAVTPFDFEARNGRIVIFQFYDLDDVLSGWSTANSISTGDRSLLSLLCYSFAVDSLFRSNYRNPSVGVITWDYVLSLRASGSLSTTYWSLVNTSLKLTFPVLLRDDFLNGFSKLHQFYNGTNPNSLATSLGFHIRFFSLSCPLLKSDVFTSSQLTVVSGTVPSSTTTELTNNLIQTIADKTALYKIRQDLLRSGVRRDKQFEVMFGVSRDSAILHEAYVLDKTTNRIDIQSLLNQAETNVAPLGQRAARGNGSSYLDFRLDTKDFGFIFIMGNVTSNLYYEAFGCNYEHMLNITSWFNPRNNYLGLEALPSHVLTQFHDAWKTAPSSSIYSVIDTQNNIGFTARDFYLKQAVNKVHGLFTNYPMPDSYQMKTMYPRSYNVNLMRGNAYFGGYLTTVLDQQMHKFANESDMYYNPYMANNLFSEMFDGAINGDFTFDHFRCVFNFECHKVSPFPKLGLLKL